MSSLQHRLDAATRSRKQQRRSIVTRSHEISTTGNECHRVEHTWCRECATELAVSDAPDLCLHVLRRCGDDTAVEGECGATYHCRVGVFGFVVEEGQVIVASDLVWR